MTAEDTIRMVFLCVQNAGRSQMAAAFAERERAERGLDGVVEIRSGGTDPADEVHEEVVRAMSEVGIDISDRTPGYVDDLEQLAESHYLVTMGCSISEFNPVKYGVESRAWDLTNPAGQDIETVRGVRDEIETKVKALFDEVEALAAEERVESTPSTGVIAAIRDALSL